MTTRSIILHANEVRAALAGTLSMVVRPVNGLPHQRFTRARENGIYLGLTMPIGKWLFDYNESEEIRIKKCHLGVPGDRLCCKETWACIGLDPVSRVIPNREKSSLIAYQLDDHSEPAPNSRRWIKGYAKQTGTSIGQIRWRSPATMPSWASRITLEVVGVRCVRAKDISEGDARQCGLPPNWCGDLAEWSADDHGFLPANWNRKMEDDYGFWTAQDSLESHWTAKYAPRYPWESSWAWAVEVRRVEG